MLQQCCAFQDNSDWIHFMSCIILIFVEEYLTQQSLSRFLFRRPTAFPFPSFILGDIERKCAVSQLVVCSCDSRSYFWNMFVIFIVLSDSMWIWISFTYSKKQCFHTMECFSDCWSEPFLYFSASPLPLQLQLFLFFIMICHPVLVERARYMFISITLSRLDEVTAIICVSLETWEE